jgi:carboxymethylenebutenolidase
VSAGNPFHPVEASWVELTLPAGRIDAYRVRPPGGRGPGLLLLQEIFGVNEHIQGVARQYALAGFNVVAPDLFWRQAKRVALGYEGADRERALVLMKTVQRDEAVADMQACIDAMRADAMVVGGVGALGYCMGGRLAFTAAALCTGLAAAVAYYGGGIATQLDVVPQLRVPVQFHHAGQDSSIPPVAVAAVKTAMAQAPAAARAEFHDYPGVQHGFNCWARGTYDAASASLALGRSLSFLSSQLFKG